MFEKYFHDRGITSVFRLIQGDITDQNTDAVVNAANTQLILGAGVAGAIRRKGGASIQQECNKKAPIKVGEAIITTGGNLAAKFVIHTAGPIWSQHSEEENRFLLKKSFLSCLNILLRNSLKSITFPAISTGIYGFPKQLAAEILIRESMNFLQSTSSELIIQICLFSKSDFDIFHQKAKNLIIDFP